MGRFQVLDDRRNETITPSRQRFDETRALGVVSQNIAQAIDGVIQAVVELDEGIGGPERLPKLLARDHLVWPLDQDLQDTKGLLRQLQPHPVLP